MKLSDIQALCSNTLISHLGIEITAASTDGVTATMPVEACVKQPFGSLHGGASVVLIETLGSIGANLNVTPGQYCVGLEVNANHLKGVRSGVVRGSAKPLHIGRRTQVWGVELVDESGALTCVGRITMAVVDKP